MALQPDFITGKVLLNLDSEDEGEIFVGCAGGLDTTAEFHYKNEAVQEDFELEEVFVKDAMGGHSGDDINKGRANAVQRSGYSLNDILDEWSREFYFEGRRRVDLIRFGKFGGTTDYIWQWKGGTYQGRNFDAFRNIFAIPASQSPAYNFVQNEGY
jgi:hypothetical protein